jgi:hypothetical protein
MTQDIAQTLAIAQQKLGTRHFDEAASPSV